MESILEYIPLPITTRKPLVEMAMSSPGHLVQIVPIVPMMVSPSLFGIAFARAYNLMPDLDQAYITVWHGSLLPRHTSDYHARGVDVMKWINNNLWARRHVDCVRAMCSRSSPF